MTDEALSLAPSGARTSDRSATPAAPPRPDALYVVSDAAGYVGAFPSEAAASAAMQPHPLVPFLVQRFAAAPGPADSVWVVLYRDLDAVAFASNDRAEAARVQQVYANVGLAYPDDIDYWEQPLGAVTEGAAARLAAQTHAHQAWESTTEAELYAAEEADAARVEALCAPRPDGPLARAIRENERIAILDAVVPWTPRAPPAQSSALMSETPEEEQGGAEGHPFAAATPPIAAATPPIAAANPSIAAANPSIAAANPSIAAARLCPQNEICAICEAVARCETATLSAAAALGAKAENEPASPPPGQQTSSS